MMKKSLFLFFFLTNAAYAAYSPSTIITDPAGVNQATVKAASTAPTATDKALVVAMSPNSTCSVTGTFWQSTQPVSIASMPTTPVTGTFWQATQPVSAASLPLPTGAATAANQTTQITSLSSIDSKLGSIGQKAMTGSAPVVIASDQSALPTKSPVNPTGTYSQVSVSGTAGSLTAPANTVAVILQGDSTNTDCVRWTMGNTPTTTYGMILQPGQDTSEIKASATVNYIACSGTQTLNIQFIKSQ